MEKVVAVRREWARSYLRRSDPYTWRTFAYWIKESDDAWKVRQATRHNLYDTGTTALYASSGYVASKSIDVLAQLSESEYPEPEYENMEPRIPVAPDPPLARKRIEISQALWRQGVPGIVLREVALSHALQSKYLLQIRNVTRAFPREAESKFLGAATPPFTLPDLSGALCLHHEKPYFDLKTLIYWRRVESLPKDVRTWPALLGYVAEAAHALACLHAQGVVHRDVKPETLFVFQKTGPGVKPTVRLGDLGISVFMDIRVDDVYTPFHVNHEHATSAYAPPEFWTTAKIDSGYRDVWSLSLVLLEVLAHEIPFRLEYFRENPAHAQKLGEETIEEFAVFWTTLREAPTQASRRRVVQRYIMTSVNRIRDHGYDVPSNLEDPVENVPAYLFHQTVNQMELFKPKPLRPRQYRVRRRFKATFQTICDWIARGLEEDASKRPRMKDLEHALVDAWKETVRVWRPDEDMAAWIRTQDQLEEPCPLVKALALVDPPIENWGLAEAKLELDAWTYRREWVDAASEVVGVVKRWFNPNTPKRPGTRRPLATLISTFGAAWKPLVIVASDWLVRYYARSLWSPVNAGVVVFVALKLVYQVPSPVSIKDAAWLAGIDEWSFRMEEQVFLKRTKMKLAFLPMIDATSDVWIYAKLMFELGGGRLP